MKPMTIIPMPITKDYYMLNKRLAPNKTTIATFMTYITEEEEHELDNNKTLNLERGDMSFTIEPINVYCYGVVDFNTDSSDYNIIEDFDFLNYLSSSGISIPSDYNFKTHQCKSPSNRIRWTETFNSAELAQYAYASIDKPERIVLFKHIFLKINYDYTRTIKMS